MKNKKIITIYFMGIILVLIIVLLIVELSTSKRNSYQLNVDIEGNDKVINFVNYNDVITKVREEYNNNDVKGIFRNRKY
ncbi:MAG: hypothetical protein L6V91_04145 [Bacilli bacterium]|nr:MAG: hypothetical protein L6V91_04145 [Bacilli bacterium]